MVPTFTESRSTGVKCIQDAFEDLIIQTTTTGYSGLHLATLAMRCNCNPCMGVTRKQLKIVRVRNILCRDTL